MIKYVCILMVTILFFSCKKDEEMSLIPDYYWGEASAIKNGEKWSSLNYGVSVANLDNQFDLVLDKFNSQGFLRERLGVSFTKEKKGFYRILNYHFFLTENNTPNSYALRDSSGASYVTILDDGDVLGDIYDVDETTNNFVEILEYDNTSKEVSGKFNITFIITRDSEWTPDSPDTIRFTNGEFHTRILDQLE